MKRKIGLLSIAFLSLFTLSFFSPGEKHKTLEIGKEAPLTSKKMKDVSGKEISLYDVKRDSGLCVIFSCNTCPFVVGSTGSEGWEGRYDEIAEDCKKYNIGMVLVNSNEAKRGEGDSFEDMKKRAAEKKYKSYYVLDEKAELANAFGAKTTPHVFLFDKNLKLVYRGAIDDNHREAEMVDESFLLAAIDNLVTGAKINPEDTKAVGCSIKRVK